MNKHQRCFSLAAVALIAAFLLSPVPQVDARKAPQGWYCGDPEAKDGTGAKGLILRQPTFNERHRDTEIKVRIPNPGGAANVQGGARGRFSGSFKSAGNSIGFPFNSRIKGRLRTSQIRQGGTKFLLTGRWNWTLNRSRLERRATGNFKWTIKRRIEDGLVTWVMKGPIRIGHSGGKPEQSYTYSGRFKAINRPPAPVPAPTP